MPRPMGSLRPFDVQCGFRVVPVSSGTLEPTWRGLRAGALNSVGADRRSRTLWLCCRPRTGPPDSGGHSADWYIHSPYLGTRSVASPDLNPAPLVLIADDEDLVRSFTAQCLSAEGYTTLMATDGVVALAILRALPAPADLLIADIRMPRMTGDELALQATQAGLVQRVLFITGFDLRPEKTQMLGPVLGKPFKGAELITAGRAIMGATSPRPA